MVFERGLTSVFIFVGPRSDDGWSLQALIREKHGIWTFWVRRYEGPKLDESPLSSKACYGN